MYITLNNALFLLYLFILSVTGNIFSQDSSSHTFRIESGLTAHILHNEIIGKNSIHSIGLSVQFPTTLNNTSLRFGADIGKLDSDDEQSYNTKFLLANISIIYAIVFPNPRFFVSPSLSLMNYALHLQPSGKIDDIAIIANWENEFGAGTGAEFSFHFNRFIIYLPLNMSTIFSLKPAYIFSCGLRVGIRFNNPPVKVL